MLLKNAPEDGEMKSILQQIPDLPEGFSFGTISQTEANAQERPREEERCTASEWMAMLSEEGYEVRRIGEIEDDPSEKMAKEFVEKKPEAKMDHSEAEDVVFDSSENEKGKTEVDPEVPNARFGPNPMKNDLQASLFEKARITRKKEGEGFEGVCTS